MKYFILIAMTLSLLACGPSRSKISGQKVSSINSNDDIVTASPKPGAQTDKLVFDQTDIKHLEKCGVKTYRQAMLDHRVNKNNAAYFGFYIKDLKLDNKDPLAISNLFDSIQPDNLSKKVAEFILQPSTKQSVEGQPFLNGSSEYKFVSRQKVNQVVNSPSDYELLKFSLIGRTEKTENNAINAVNYTFNMDINSAYWFKVSTERVAECMEKNGFAAKGSSRDSIQAYTALSIIEKLNSQSPKL